MKIKFEELINQKKVKEEIERRYMKVAENIIGMPNFYKQYVYLTDEGNVYIADGFYETDEDLINNGKALMIGYAEGIGEYSNMNEWKISEYLNNEQLESYHKFLQYKYGETFTDEYDDFNWNDVKEWNEDFYNIVCGWDRTQIIEENLMSIGNRIIF
ncbi:hypothetical protein GCM10008908_09400 [Clostridium subterminale]|uniref:DUF4375 domain-containing protein n=1 Tax=Clostridium subterminale TaxID=1550 RepID=A0ABP3VXY2_CLOSU